VLLSRISDAVVEGGGGGGDAIEATIKEIEREM
jgi:hypothetical protein